jgi:hypothetical protein
MKRPLLSTEYIGGITLYCVAYERKETAVITAARRTMSYRCLYIEDSDTDIN